MISQVYLRDVLTADAAFVLECENNVEWNVSDPPVIYTIFDILQLIHELQEVEIWKQARWVICDRETERQLGVVDLTEIDFVKKEASVGVFIVESKERRKGFASAALSMLTEKAKDLGLERLTATVALDNQKSHKLFLKNDFEKIGEIDTPYMKDGEYIKAIIYDKCLKN